MLVDLVLSLRNSTAEVVFPDSGTVVPHRLLPDLAARFAGRLVHAGVRPGAVVGLLMPTEAAWLPAFFGVPWCGAVVTVLPLPPVVLDVVAAADALRPAVAAAGIEFVVASGAGKAVAARLPGVVVIDPAEPADHTEPADALMRPVVAEPDSPALIQFSSGSTARPKGVVLSHRALRAGVTAINEHIRVTPHDVLLQWVPLFHDMGLVALLCSFAGACQAQLLAAKAFLRDPAGVLELIAGTGATIVTGPNFSYDAFVAAAKPAALPRWRLALNGAEMVSPGTVTEFQREFGALGVPPSAMYPCYGLAEATLAVTLPRLGSVPRTVTVDRDRAEVGRPVEFAETGRTLVGVGIPVPGMSVRITDGAELPAGWLGEIEIRGESVTSGYLDGTTPWHDGWLRTGDLGFWHDGELFVAGRRKEMIIVQGRNVFADDVENAVRDLPGVHRRACVAVADPDEERVVVVVETAQPEHDRLVAAVNGAVQRALGVSVRVVPVKPRSLPRTTSGKWRRTAVRDLVLHNPVALREITHV